MAQVSSTDVGVWLRSSGTNYHGASAAADYRGDRYRPRSLQQDLSPSLSPPLGLDATWPTLASSSTAFSLIESAPACAEFASRALTTGVAGDEEGSTAAGWRGCCAVAVFNGVEASLPLAFSFGGGLRVVPGEKSPRTTNIINQTPPRCCSPVKVACFSSGATRYLRVPSTGNPSIIGKQSKENKVS